MIDEWAVSVKPSADPTIIKKHIEKMVEVSADWNLRDSGRLRGSHLLFLPTTIFTLQSAPGSLAKYLVILPTLGGVI